MSSSTSYIACVATCSNVMQAKLQEVAKCKCKKRWAGQLNSPDSHQLAKISVHQIKVYMPHLHSYCTLPSPTMYIISMLPPPHLLTLSASPVGEKWITTAPTNEKLRLGSRPSRPARNGGAWLQLPPRIIIDSTKQYIK